MISLKSDLICKQRGLNFYNFSSNKQSLLPKKRREGFVIEGSKEKRKIFGDTFPGREHGLACGFGLGSALMTIQVIIHSLAASIPVGGSQLMTQTKNGSHFRDCRFSLFGDPDGNRTRVTAVKGRCLSRLTTGPLTFKVYHIKIDLSIVF